MKNVTITMEDSVLEWARIEAARRGTSVSRMVGDFVAEMMQREDAYERAYLAWRTDERSWQAGAKAEVVQPAKTRSASTQRIGRSAGQPAAKPKPAPKTTKKGAAA